MIDAEGVRRLLEVELEPLSDPLVRAHVQSLLVEPECVMRRWPWSKEPQSFACWTVLSHVRSRTGIAYCEQGFGPKNPWGLIFTDPEGDMGGDYGWYPKFSHAYWESHAPTDLPIWQVFKSNTGGDAVAITEEDSSDNTWARVLALRTADPSSTYNCWSGRALARMD